MLKAVLQIGVMALLLGSPAWAQVEPEAGGSPEGSGEESVQTLPAPTGLTAEEVSDEQVQQLATALLQIEPMLRSASESLSEAESDEQRQQIAANFEQQATQTVVTVGLTVEQYRQLIELANSDPEFGQRVAAQLDEMMPAAQEPEVQDPEAEEPEVQPEVTPVE